VLPCACSIALVKFASRGEEQYVVVGTVKDLQLRPRSMTCGYLVLYRLSHSGDSLELVHRTEVDDLPAAITPFQGRLLVGVGRYLRVYDYGKKKLLRKCENKVCVSNNNNKFVRPRWPYDMRPSARGEKYMCVIVIR